MLTLLVNILVICIIAWVITYIVGQFPIPAPINRIIPLIVWVIAALLILKALLPLLGGVRL
jgi:hypothetical protein